ncbi:G protein pathway suppressor 1 [Trametes coccinea BRFM310]|uniref:G protein pathway suppressor 1 n=1 Tax=Trametes coccinea (strain BRFM310) TaxID=1353009 RepID=A0A1Y2IIS2_TRAC3|nr:G protein pathway suppressor 1 [Trametes coccinea BRFM310]
MAPPSPPSVPHSQATMDVDEIDEGSQQQLGSQLNAFKAAGKRRVVIDEAHPFELETYISSYSGRTYVDRLLHIMSTCPTLAPQALQLAVEEALKGRDTELYLEIFHRYQRAHAEARDEIPELSALAEPDQRWIEETNARNQAERTKLEVELKTYSSNMIKESIRMAHRDLGDFYRSLGEYTNALKHYTKSREFCTTSQHVLDMCMSVIELLMEQRNYSHIATYVFKAEAALDSASMVRGQSGPEAPAGAAQANKEKKNAERLRAQTKLDVATGLSHLGQSNYEKAAQTFLKAGPVKGLEDWTGKLIAPGDIAIYATLSALATFPRSTIRAQILDSDDFSMYIEQEPYIRELLESYMNNRFKNVLEILERYSTRHYLDIHLYQHVQNLTNLIRSKSLVLYFQPFSSIKLERMGQAFGWSVQELEQQVVALIQAGEIKARVDRQNKILKAKETDQRAALFAKAMKSGQDIQAANRKLLLRMRLQQADLVVKPPKGQSQGYSYGTGHASEFLSGDY